MTSRQTVGPKVLAALLCPKKAAKSTLAGVNPSLITDRPIHDSQPQPRLHALWLDIANVTSKEKATFPFATLLKYALFSSDPESTARQLKIR